MKNNHIHEGDEVTQFYGSQQNSRESMCFSLKYLLCRPTMRPSSDVVLWRSAAWLFTSQDQRRGGFNGRESVRSLEINMNILLLISLSSAVLIPVSAQDAAGPTGASIVPVVGSCHKIISGTATSGRVRSHDGFPSTPYAPGYQCRTVVSVPFGRTVEITVGGNANSSGLRPWDYAVLVDGSVSRKLNFMCDVEQYKKTLGHNGEHYVAIVQKSLAVTRTFKSSTQTIVIDFCVHTFDKELSNRKGFELMYTSSVEEDSSAEAPPQAMPLSDMDVDDELPGRAHPHEPLGTDLSKPASFRQLTCGRPRNPPSTNPNPNRIINGVLARKNSWPWIGAMIREPDFQFCGSTLISDEWVLTAGHCVDSFTDDRIIKTVKIVFGVEDLTTATPANTFRVTKVVRHEKYNDPVGSTSNDIALLKLDRKVVTSNDTMPACLPSKSVFEKPYAQTAPNNRRICYVAGWGHLVGGQHGDTGGKIGAGTDQLQQVALEIMSTDDCKTFLKGLYTEKTFCAGHDNGKYDSCQGDSGGPVVCDDGPEHGWSLHGIVSWGFGCAQPKAPAAHTHVALMLDWIFSKIRS